MKKMKLLLGVTLAVSLLAAGCGSKTPEKPAAYSNLNEESIRFDLDSLLATAGVSDQQRHVLFNHVDQINQQMNPAELTNGFEPVGAPKYDPYALQEKWMETYPDFLGYNCRITAFSLLPEGMVTMPEDVRPRNDLMLEFDLNALEYDNSAFPEKVNQFWNLFEVVPTEATKDVQVHANNVLNAWKERGITFTPNPNISLINVVFHYGDENILFVGHSGLLLPTPDGELWFLEKISFQEPYQLVKFQNRAELQSYLMNKYDLDENQPTAKPFILENDAMMKA